MPENPSEIDAAKAKASLLSAILKAHSDAYDAKDMESLQSHIVSSLRQFGFARASLLSLPGFTVSAVSGAKCQPGSEFVVNLREIVAPLSGLDRFVKASKESLDEAGALPPAYGALDYFASVSPAGLYIAPLLKPESVEPASSAAATSPESVIAVIVKGFASALAKLRRPSVKMAAFDVLGLSAGGFLRRAPWRAAGIFAFFAVVVLFGVRPRLISNAEFEVVPFEGGVHYAPVDGLLKDARFKNGSKVGAGQDVVLYESAELLFDLSEARRELDEASADLERVRQLSWSDDQELGKLKALSFRREAKAVKVARMEDRLAKASVKAASSGILCIDDADGVKGRAVRAGDKLFEVVSQDRLVAKVMLDERQAAPLEGLDSVVLHFNVRPELSIASSMVSVTPVPMPSSNGRYCYVLKVEPKDASFARTGLRGVAKVRGQRVSLCYFLLRDLVMWWRGV